MNHRKMKRDYQETTTTTNSECSSSLSSIPNHHKNGKAKMGCWEVEDSAGAVDGDLAKLGFSVRASDMADVALKLEQLEMVMGSSQDELFTAQLSDTVHYNPSDIFGWVQSMLSEINPSPNDVFNPPSEMVNSFEDASEYDLRAIPGMAAYPPPVTPPQESSPKRLKTAPAEAVSTELSSTAAAAGGRGVVLLDDTQEAGVRLVHTLMACAEAVQQNDTGLADALVKRVGLLAASQSGAMSKVATHFAEALARRIYAIYPQNDIFSDQSTSDMLHLHFYETGPYLKFAHFTANQAILEAFATSSRVHVIDFGLNQGMQWPALMQALALRPGGPPKFRLTGIGPPQSDDTDALQQVGWKLAQLAETLGVEFEFRGFVASSPADIEPKMLELRPGETVAVNSVFELHRLLARDGAFERVMRSIRAMKPKIVTVVEQEASHNGEVFLDRFTEALHYYSTMFDSLEISPPTEDLMMSEVYLGKQICNVVACEGPDRVERHERVDRWRERFGSGGFEPVHLGSNAFKQASMLLALFAGGNGYRVEANDGCLMLGWHNRPLIATSAWRVAERPK